LGLLGLKGRRELVGLLKQKYLLGAATIALAIPVGAGGASADPQLDAVLQRLERLERENAKLKNELNRIEAKTSKPVQVKVVPAKADGKADPNATNSGFVQVNFPKGVYGGTATLNEPVSYKGEAGEDEDWYFRHKPGSKLTFMTPNGQITAYGQLDVSADITTKGIDGFVGGGGDHPIGNVGWMPALSTNISYVGIRGYQNLGDWSSFKDGGAPLRFVYQLETGLDISATSGTPESNSNKGDTVRGGLTSRNSYVGLASDAWGSIKGGKTSAPYANSTAMMNPFSGMLGDYNVVMGNTGGDNRTEFNTRLDHSVWYESPNMSVAGGKFSFAALYSPGQNRASNSDNLAAGESDCSGGNSPISGGFSTCSDGAFSDAYSISGTFQTKINNVGVLVTGAYERHQKVNRSSDILAIYGIGANPVFITPPTGSPIGDSLYRRDVADEDAAKIGVQLSFASTGTTVSGIFESMHRYVDADLQFQNERQRNGTWLAVTQALSERDNINFGWAHAFRTPGDPGQHNDATLTTGDVGSAGPTAFAPNHNAADMLTVAYKREIYSGLTWYIDYAATINQSSAHYDLGAGGRGVTTDCHDANSNPTSGGGIGGNPHCWTGGLLQGVSTGIRYNF
jgi:predicted porin